MSYQRLSKKREQEEVQAKDNFHAIIEENNKLNEELRQMFGKRAPSRTEERPQNASPMHEKVPARLRDEVHVRKDTAVSFGGSKRGEISEQSKRSGDIREYRDGLYEGSRENEYQSSKRNVREPADFKPHDDERLRETIEALEYIKKREKGLQEEVKALNQVILKKDQVINGLEARNKILLANKIEVESRMADLIQQSDEILSKYQRLKAINLELQEKLGQMEQEVSRQE